MSLYEWVKIFNKPNFNNKIKREFSLVHNKNKIEDFKVVTSKLHSDIYSLLRTYKKPQYNTAFLLRRKKGFNTFGFNLNYDIFIADKNGKIIEILNDVEPGFVSEHYREAHNIYFTNVGSINFYKFEIKDRVILSRI